MCRKIHQLHEAFWKGRSWILGFCYSNFLKNPTVLLESYVFRSRFSRRRTQGYGGEKSLGVRGGPLGSARVGPSRIGSARIGPGRLGSARLGSAQFGTEFVDLSHSSPGPSPAWIFLDFFPSSYGGAPLCIGRPHIYIYIYIWECPINCLWKSFRK
jgi:hypothetical protein